MTREEALAVLAPRAGIDPPGEDEPVGPAVEPTLCALRDGADITDGELAAALALMPAYVQEVQRAIVGAARLVPAGGRGSRMTLYEVGIAIGFPPKSASMRAMNLARSLGLAPPAKPRSTTDRTD